MGLQVCEGSGRAQGQSLTSSPMKKAPGVFVPEACEGGDPAQVRYWIRNSEMPGKNSSSKVRTVSLIRKGMMPL